MAVALAPSGLCADPEAGAHLEFWSQCADEAVRLRGGGGPCSQSQAWLGPEQDLSPRPRRRKAHRGSSGRGRPSSASFPSHLPQRAVGLGRARPRSGIFAVYGQKPPGVLSGLAGGKGLFIRHSGHLLRVPRPLGTFIQVFMYSFTRAFVHAFRKSYRDNGPVSGVAPGAFVPGRSR